MMATDSLGAADERESTFSDARVKQLWDPDRTFGQLLSHTLCLQETVAWDVYLVYATKSVWDADLPPMPEFWMHQQPDEEPTHWLDPSRLKEYVQTLLERTALQ
jgi:hypothetical protein